MITVGLVKELYYISHFFNTTLTTTLSTSNSRDIIMKVSPVGDLDVFAGDEHIWYEKIEGSDSFFGIESCDTISRIIACINNGTPWEQYKWVPLE